MEMFLKESAFSEQLLNSSVEITPQVAELTPVSVGFYSDFAGALCPLKISKPSRNLVIKSQGRAFTSFLNRLSRSGSGPEVFITSIRFTPNGGFEALSSWQATPANYANSLNKSFTSFERWGFMPAAVAKVAGSTIYEAAS